MDDKKQLLRVFGEWDKYCHYQNIYKCESAYMYTCQLEIWDKEDRIWANFKISLSKLLEKIKKKILIVLDMLLLRFGKI